jgi:2-amino-4-hydroxy-6-hydroxymethyldihydropteridine diphosphokinase
MNPANHQACLLVGSNIRAEENLRLALQRLQEWVVILEASSVWETAAVGSDGPDFLNLALLVATPLEATELKGQVLRPLEAGMGRVRSADKNAPRPIDLDIIVFDGEPVDGLLWKHAYRAVPVAELLPDLRSDSGETLKQAAERLSALEKIKLSGCCMPCTGMQQPENSIT